MFNKRNAKSFGKLRALRGLGVLATAALLTSVSLVASAKDDHGLFRSTRYRQINFVSDQPGVALVQDPNLINAWGISYSPAGPFWVSATESGRSMVYSVTNDSSGMPQVTKLALEVAIPGEGNPTGQVFNDTTAFNGDIFLFVSEDGVISGWRAELGTSAEILATRSNAVYKGVTLVTTSSGPMLLAANFAEGTVDVYDGTMNLVSQLTDSNAPPGYAPFNVRAIEHLVFVTFAKQDDEKEDDVPGPGHGLIDILNVATGRFQRFVTGSDAGGRFRAVDSPWGIAVAPRSFGKHGDQVLIGNFGSGTIMSFDEHGHFRGFLESRPGHPIVIEGLWALTFGNGGRAGVPDTLYFTAGPEDETHGLFGSIESVSKRDLPGIGDRDDDRDDDNGGDE